MPTSRTKKTHPARSTPKRSAPSSKNRPLEAYRQKRRFGETPEPKGEVRPARGTLRFVIQEHHATRFHHDFRLEMEGVLRSWAVPKGISMDPGDKRLAVAVEDHPMDYGDFEGNIPEGNYGAGTVMLWDRGTYESLEGDPAEGFRKGKLTVVLHGQKISGEFHLVRTRMRGQSKDDGKQWLIFKKNDGDAVPGWTLAKPARSVKTGRTIEEIRREESDRWFSTDAPPAATPPRGLRALGIDKPGGDPFPKNIAPMLAKIVDEPPKDSGWLFEIKWDGVRCVAYVRRDGPKQTVLLQSRNLNTVNTQYPEIVEALYAAGLPDTVLDGEVVAIDAHGRPSFQRLQQRINLSRATEVTDLRGQIPLLFYAFDILYYNGHAVMDRPLSERRRILEAVLPQTGTLRVSDAFADGGETFYRVAQAQQLEGIVAKRERSVYEPGRRSGAWVKVKVRRTLAAVVGGYTAGRRGRKSTFGALLLGLYDAKGRLQPIGHAGGGFTDRALAEVLERLRSLEQKEMPFAVTPASNEPPTWVRPEVVVRVEFTEWTDEGILRAPVFKGIDPDVPPHDCRLEEVRPGQAPRDDADPPSGRSRASAARAGTQKTARGGGAQREPSSPLEREVARRRLPVQFTNLKKIYWPGLGLTKGDLISYYLAIHEAILPHLRDRPLTLRRFPDGIDGEAFYQKDYPDAPPYVTTAKIWTETTKSSNDNPVCNNLATLLWLGQLGCIETHTWYSRITPAKRGEGRGETPHTDFGTSEERLDTSVLNYPDQLVFDIDPFIYPQGEGPRSGPGEKDPEYNRAGFDASVEAALLLREVLEGLGLRLFVKTTGKTGVHIYVPILRQYTYDETHAFAKTISQYLSSLHPDKLTTDWAVERRVGKVFLDYNQNRREATLAGPYSLRPNANATVSTPLTWKEVERGIDPLTFTYATIPERVRAQGDPWAEMGKAAQSLEAAISAAAGASAKPRKRRAARTPDTARKRTASGSPSQAARNTRRRGQAV